MPFPIQFLQLVLLSVLYVGVCARAYMHVSGKTGLASMVKIWIQIKPFVHILALRLPGIGLGKGERLSEHPFLYLCSETKEEKGLL